MTESLPASRDIDRIRKELKDVNKKLDKVSRKVDDVDEKVDRSNSTQLGALAAALSRESAKDPVLLYGAGMKIPDIARVVGRSVNAVRIELSRAGLTSRPKKARAPTKAGPRARSKSKSTKP